VTTPVNPIPAVKRVRIGEVLVEEGILTEQQLQRALAEQKATGRMLGEMLVEQGVIQPQVLVQALARRLGYQGCHLRHGLIDPALLKLIGEEEATRLKAIPLFKVRDTLTVAMAEPQSLPAIDRLRQLTNCKIRAVLALENNITEYIKKYAGGNVDVDAFLASLSGDSDVKVVEREATAAGQPAPLREAAE
jgi:type IV pilus assembly protein PilB